ncbi:hypothetical protein NCCP2716_27900 [Sporosarcina sp. NCCP-2716]|uniref:hypothetical protein n=1 Tax=Sporosarcina sp. NCCP-2716 TaxID=2943679 RepID=UPI00203B109F|nr:hypothetical protein [Sporosarcina sp. NCCP-2716]GKV70292.1 hypothetical protein NCCP2716_27900 [Sporosarcina sp. NCCP-2716]
MLKDMLSMLTSALSQKPQSNIGKLFAVFALQHDEVLQTLRKMEEWVDVDKAEGKELNELGADIEQPRGLATDAQYRMMIKSKRIRAKSDGTYNAIIDAMAKTLNCRPSDMRLTSDRALGGTEPLALVVEKLPLAVMNNAGLTQSQLIALIERVAPGDVRVASANLEGTFEFGSIAMEADSEKGFGNVEGTIGGYLGAAYAPSGNQELPI